MIIYKENLKNKKFKKPFKETFSPACTNIPPDWKDDYYGDDCSEYEKNSKQSSPWNWCEKDGDLPGTGGHTAKHSCCACGGGHAPRASCASGNYCPEVPYDPSVNWVSRGGLICGDDSAPDDSVDKKIYNFWKSTEHQDNPELPGQCTDAYYGTSKDGITAAVACPACGGGEILPASSYAIPCPVGTYNPNESEINANACRPCSAGTVCPNERRTTDGTECAEGSYCPAVPLTRSYVDWESIGGHDCSYKEYQAGGALCTDPEIGTSKDGITAVEACLVCGGGEILPASSYAIPCPVGTYSDAPGAVSCTTCPRNGRTHSEGSTKAGDCEEPWRRAVDGAPNWGKKKVDPVCFRTADKKAIAGVRCIEEKEDGSLLCNSLCLPHEPVKNKTTYAGAEAICSNFGKRLPTESELQLKRSGGKDLCQQTGCGYDNELVWTSDICK